MVQPLRRKRVADNVRRRIGGGQRGGDDEVRGGKTEQAEDERLSPPAREELLEHRNPAVPGRTGGGDAVVNRPRAGDSEQAEGEGGDRGKVVSGEQGDAGLVAERREVVHTG